VFFWGSSVKLQEKYDHPEEAFAKYGQPEIFNTDQGSQFTSEDFTGALKARSVAISMDGKGGHGGVSEFLCSRRIVEFVFA
jgi:putative transposase